jgi:hypothetical protein
MWLIKAYQMGGQLKRAIALLSSRRSANAVGIALSQLLTNHPHSQVNTWANKNLTMLSKEISRA